MYSIVVTSCKPCHNEGDRESRRVMFGFFFEKIFSIFECKYRNLAGADCHSWEKSAGSGFFDRPLVCEPGKPGSASSSGVAGAVILCWS